MKLMITEEILSFEKHAGAFSIVGKILNNEETEVSESKDQYDHAIENNEVNDSFDSVISHD